MSDKTKIEWSDSTWNPIRGCSRVSEGCRHCYAERQAARFSGPGQPYEGLVQLANGHPQWTGKIAFVEKHLLDPLRWRSPRRIFVNSMSDLFHENVTDEMRDRIFAVMALCPQHTFQVLTKRPERMLKYLTEATFREGVRYPARRAIGLMMVGMITEEPETARLVLKQPGETLSVRGEEGSEGELCEWPLPNVWLGVSVENQKGADERIPLLLQTPAAVRFVSAEPLLGPLDLAQGFTVRENVKQDALYGSEGLRWVIVGGESGPGARPMQIEWAKSLRDQCKAAGVAFFMKQMGSVYGPNKGHDIPADLDIKQFLGERR